MFSSLRARLWLSYALMIATALTVVAVVLLFYLIQNPALTRQTMDRLRAAESIIQNQSQEILSSQDSELLQRVAQTFNVRVAVYDSNQNLLLDTNPIEPALQYVRRPLLNRLFPELRAKNGKVWLFTTSSLPNGDTLLVAALRPRTQILGVFTDELLIPLLEGAVIALVLSLVLAFVVARWVADPLQQVIGAARGFPAHEIHAVPVRGPREIQELTQTFNDMVGRVQSSQKSQRDFVANVSHELKTPLTSIQGFSQAIMDGTADTPEARHQAAEVIYNESSRMHRLVLDLLDLARLDAGTADLKMSPLDARALLNAVTEKFSLQAQKEGVTLHVQTSPNLPALIGDGDRLAQVFTNLVDNALKFTPNGGQVILRAAQVGPEMEFEVQDTGRGVPREALEHIFDRFYQADPSRPRGERQGAGLGLAIVREIVQAHGGRISVRSQPGQGTSFILFLPLAQPTASTFRRKK